ncbi:hypothetical protein ABZP36_034188 [Zizania latifolia]
MRRVVAGQGKGETRGRVMAEELWRAAVLREARCLELGFPSLMEAVMETPIWTSPRFKNSQCGHSSDGNSASASAAGEKRAFSHGSPKRFTGVIQNLTEEQKNLVREIGFGKICYFEYVWTSDLNLRNCLSRVASWDNENLSKARKLDKLNESSSSYGKLLMRYRKSTSFFNGSSANFSEEIHHSDDLEGFVNTLAPSDAQLNLRNKLIAVGNDFYSKCLNEFKEHLLKKTYSYVSDVYKVATEICGPSGRVEQNRCKTRSMGFPSVGTSENDLSQETSFTNSDSSDNTESSSDKSIDTIENFEVSTSSEFDLECEGGHIIQSQKSTDADVLFSESNVDHAVQLHGMPSSDLQSNSLETSIAHHQEEKSKQCTNVAHTRGNEAINVQTLLHSLWSSSIVLKEFPKVKSLPIFEDNVIYVISSCGVVHKFDEILEDTIADEIVDNFGFMHPEPSEKRKSLSVDDVECTMPINVHHGNKRQKQNMFVYTLQDTLCDKDVEVSGFMHAQPTMEKKSVYDHVVESNLPLRQEETISSAGQRKRGRPRKRVSKLSKRLASPSVQTKAAGADIVASNLEKKDKLMRKNLSTAEMKDSLKVLIDPVLTEMVFIPCCKNDHWFLVCVNFPTEMFDIFDSIFGEHNINESVYSVVANFKSVFHEAFPCAQNMITNCGIYVLKFMQSWDGRTLIHIDADRVRTIREKLAFYLLTHRHNSVCHPNIKSILDRDDSGIFTLKYIESFDTICVAKFSNADVHALRLKFLCYLVTHKYNRANQAYVKWFVQHYADVRALRVK